MILPTFLGCPVARIPRQKFVSFVFKYKILTLHMFRYVGFFLVLSIYFTGFGAKYQ